VVFFSINTILYFYFSFIKNLIYIALFLVSFNGVGQNFSKEQQHQIDSLNKVIASPNSHDTSLASAYVALSEILYVSNIDTLKFLCEKAKIITEKALEAKPAGSIKKSLLKSLAGALNNIGYVYQNQGNISKALAYYHKSLKIYEEIGDREGVAMNLNNIGLVYLNQGDIIKTLENFHKSLKIQEEIGDKKGLAYSLNNIGYIYGNQGDIVRELEYYHKSLKIYEEIGDKKGLANSLNNIGTIYQDQGDMINGLIYYNKSLKIKEEIGDKSGIAVSLNNIGLIYKNQGDIIKALRCYHKSLKIYEEIGDKKGIAQSLTNIGHVELEKGGKSELKVAEKQLGKALELAQEIGYPHIISKASSNLSKVYEKQGKGLAALKMYQLSITMRDSMNNEATQKATIQQQAKYEYEKQKAMDDAEHDKLFAIRHEQKQKQRILMTAIAGSLVLVVGSLIFVFNRLRITKKQKLVIEEKNQEIMDSIIYAKRIQSAILPPAKVIKEYLQESFIFYKPKDIVAGDFYWLEHKNGKVLFAAADCTGHGVPGAMVSVICNNGLNRSVREHGITSPGEILNKTREIVIEEFEKSEEEVKDGMDIALCSLEGNKLEYAGANNPLWIIRKGELIETKANKQPIGQFDNPEPYATHSFELEKGDTIYIFSDGYVDQFGGEKGKKFKSPAFRELLLSVQGQSMEEQKKIIEDIFETWKGNLDQIDDVCVIGVRV